MPRGSRRSPGPLSQAIAEVVWREIQAQGLTQAAAGELAGVKQSTMSALLRGVTAFTVDELADLCAAIGLDIVDVIAEARSGD